MTLLKLNEPAIVNGGSLKLETKQIQNMIYFIRNQRVMLDSDLAELYGVSTKELVQAVKRNRERFPCDFMFQSENDELSDLRSQFVTASPTKRWNHKRRTLPFLFTESGVAMLSSVLKSNRGPFK